MAGDRQGLWRDWGCHERTRVGSAWEAVAVRAVTGTGSGVGSGMECSGPRRQRHNGDRGGDGPLAPKQLLFPSIFFSAACI